MNTIIKIPHGVMRVLTCNWQIDWRTQSAGMSTDGGEQIFGMGFPRWIGSPTVSLRGDTVRLWRATRARARGRMNVYRVPLIDRDDIRDAYGQTDYAGRALDGAFGDGPVATLAAAAAAGATEIVVTEQFYPALVGAFVSIADWPYIVVDRVREGQNWRLTIEMPLRRGAAAGAVVNLRAHGLFRASDDLMGNPEIAANGFSRPELSFEEWITRP
ncbi:hypothetical protein QCN27_03920 [Cereibacter sp. SYSU M97828]|nr:hypothetical protein [Cereibacter flavus]